MGQCISKREVMKQNDVPISRIKNQNKLIDKVLEEKKFHLYSITEFGQFGPIINIKFPPMKEKIAVKILEAHNIGEEELQWYTLYNENIIGLIHIEFVEKIDLFLFYAEDWEYSLKEMTENKLLRRSEDGLRRVMKWMKQTAEGLNYMHCKNCFHLNISTENVVITEKDSAKICNFHWICSREAFNIKKYGLPMEFAPPEIFCDGKAEFSVSPEKYDIWAYGILLVNILTGEQLSRKLIPSPKYWSFYIYPVIYKVLKAKKFKQMVRRNFPTSHKVFNLKSIRSTATYILSFDPIIRPSASEIIYLLNRIGVELQLQDGNIWKKKVSFNPLEREMQCMSFAKKSSIADRKVTIYSGVGFEDEDTLADTSAKILYVDVPSMMEDLNGKPDPYIKDNEMCRDYTDSKNSSKVKSLDSNVNITPKGVFSKFISWALEEHFYSGIMHNESYINKLSKSLTG